MTDTKKHQLNEEKFRSDDVDLSKVHSDFYELFALNHKKNMLCYVFEDPKKYEDVISNPNYYLFKEEAELISQNKVLLGQYLQNIETLIELGPGSKNSLIYKTLPLLKCASALSEYIALDISENYLEKISEFIEQNTNLQVSLIQSNFLESIPPLPNNGKNKAIVLLGGTLGGFDEDDRIKCLQNISSFAESGDVFIISADTNLDKESLLRAYSTEASKNIVMEVFEYYASVNLDFKPYKNCFDMKTEWEESSRTISHELSSLQDFSFKIKSHEDIQVSKGQEFQIVRVHKFCEEEFTKLLNSMKLRVMSIAGTGNIKLFITMKY